MNIKVSQVISSNDLKKYLSVIFQYLEEQKIDKIISLNISKSDASNIIANVTAFNHKGIYKVIFFELEILENKKVNIKTNTLVEEPAQDLKYTTEMRDSDTFDPAVPILRPDGKGYNF